MNEVQRYYSKQIVCPNCGKSKFQTMFVNRDCVCDECINKQGRQWYYNQAKGNLKTSNMNVVVKFLKLHADAIIPKLAHKDDACMDLYGVRYELFEDGNLTVFTGLACEIPVGYCMLLYPRSSISKTKFRLTNSVGVVDAGYRGEIMLKFKDDSGSKVLSAMDLSKAVAQFRIVPVLDVKCVEVDELSDSERGTGGFGSTDKK